MKPLVARLTSPAGFLLALVFFLLPFVAVSCEVPGVGSAEISYSGLDLATGATPSVDTAGEFNRETGAPVPKDDDAPTPDVQILAIITLVLLAIGLGVSLTPILRTRTYGALAAATIGGALLITTEAVAQSNLKAALVEGTRKATADRPGDIPLNFNLTGSIFDDLVESRIGFWLSLIAVILVLLFNAGQLLLPRLRPAPQPPPWTPQPAEAPPPPPTPEPDPNPPQQ